MLDRFDDNQPQSDLDYAHEMSHFEEEMKRCIVWYERHVLERKHKAETRNKRFHLWLGDNPVHDTKTKELVRWERTELSQEKCRECWAKGVSPRQEFDRLFPDT